MISENEARYWIREGVTPRKVETVWTRRREHAFEDEYGLPRGLVKQLANRWGIQRDQHKPRKHRK